MVKETRKLKFYTRRYLFNKKKITNKLVEQKKGIRYIENKKQRGRNKSDLFGDYIRYTLIRYYNHRQKLEEWRKEKPMIQLYAVYKTHISDSITHICRVKGQKLIFYRNNNQKKSQNDYTNIRQILTRGKMDIL